MKNRSFGERLGFATAGLRAGWTRERSFRTQVGSAAAAAIILLMLRPAPIWWAVVAVVSAVVLLLELVNSAFEALIDLLHPGLHPEIKAIKDMMAGAVLLASVTALIVGIALLIEQWPLLLAWTEAKA